MRNHRTDQRLRRSHVVSYVGVDDAGNVVSPAIVEGQIMGGVAQGVGSVLGERIVYDEAGQLVTSSFMYRGCVRDFDKEGVETILLSTKRTALRKPIA